MPLLVKFILPLVLNPDTSSFMSIMMMIGSVIIILTATGPFLAYIRHYCLLCQLCLEHCFETVRMRLKVTQSIVELEVVQ